ncbi:MAG: hypothetical protein ACLUD2_18005 [Clostridium sp.]
MNALLVFGHLNVGTAGVNKEGETYIATLPRVFMTEEEFRFAKKMADRKAWRFLHRLLRPGERMEFKDIEKIFGK